MLVQQLLVDQPFAATFGQTGHAWKTCAQALSRARDPEGLLVFGAAGVSDKSIKTLWRPYNVRQERSRFGPISFWSDNKPGAGKQGELASALEDLYETYSSVMSDCKAAGASVAKKRPTIWQMPIFWGMPPLECSQKMRRSWCKKRKSAIGGAESITTTSSSSCGTPSEASSAKRFRLPSDVQQFVNLSSERMEGHRLHIQSKEERKNSNRLRPSNGISNLSSISSKQSKQMICSKYNWSFRSKWFGSCEGSNSSIQINMIGLGITTSRAGATSDQLLFLLLFHFATNESDYLYLLLNKTSELVVE